MKKCYKCNNYKEYSEFHKNKYKKDGHKDECKFCVKIERNLPNSYIKKWRLNNPGYSTIQHKKWRILNLFKHNTNTAKYRASKLKATPKWLTKVQLLEIEQFYKDAEYLTFLTKENIVVDHIMPLRGKNSCGLHVPWNLQLLTSIDNAKKSNKII